MEKTGSYIRRGVHLTALRTDKFKFGLLSLSFLLPLTAENASAVNLAARVINRGCEKYPTLREISLECDRLYSASVTAGCGKAGEALMMSFYVSTLDNAYAFDGTDVFGGAVALLGELLRRPLLENGGFRSEYLESEKKNLTDDIRAQINNKTSYAVNRCIALMCENERFAVNGSGDIDLINALDGRTLYEKYTEILQNAPVEICYVGLMAAEEVADKLQSSLALTDRAPELPQTDVVRRAGEVREIAETMDISQGKLSIGFRTGTCMYDEDYLSFSLFCTLFGSSPTSRLFLNVREKLSLCYYCSPVPDGLKGTMIVACGIDCANKEKATEAILRELEEVQNGRFTDEELDNAVRAMRNSYREAMDSPAALSSWFTVRSLAGITRSPEEYAALLSGCTREDIVRAAKRLTLDTIYFLKGKDAQ